MTDWYAVYPALFFLGLLLGLSYFGGLWFTVRRITMRRHPGLLMTVSFILRNVIVIAGLYWGMQGDWKRLLTMLAGLLLMRTIMIGRIEKDNSAKTKGMDSPEKSHRV